MYNLSKKERGGLVCVSAAEKYNCVSGAGKHIYTSLSESDLFYGMACAYFDFDILVHIVIFIF